MPQTFQVTQDSWATAALKSLRVLVSALTRSARGIEEHTGITNAQLFLLRQLGDGRTLSINDLAVRAHTRQNTVSSVVGRLGRQGLVEKVRAADDGRRVELTITQRGRRLLARAPVAPTEALIEGLETMPLRQLESLTIGLSGLLVALDLSMDEAPMLFEDVPGGLPASGETSSHDS